MMNMNPEQANEKAFNIATANFLFCLVDNSAESGDLEWYSNTDNTERLIKQLARTIRRARLLKNNMAAAEQVVREYLHEVQDKTCIELANYLENEYGDEINVNYNEIYMLLQNNVSYLAGCLLRAVYGMSANLWDSEEEE